MRRVVSAGLFALVLGPIAWAEEPVRVVLDMDSGTPGIQSTIRVAPGTTLVEGVAVYVYDPVGGRQVLSIGYLGGLDRGISLGHTPTPGNIGHVGAFSHLTPVAPVNPGNTGWVYPAQDRGFEGPEVQYNELNAPAPAPIQTTPDKPIFTVDVELAGASTGDVFRLYLLDFVTVWRAGQGGAFTADAAHFLETGGDSVPDQTLTLHGPDPDPPSPVPPAAFLVDYIDGPGTIVVGCYVDCDGSGVLNIKDFICFQTKFALGDPYADCDGNGVRNINDFVCFQTGFAVGCP